MAKSDDRRYEQRQRELDAAAKRGEDIAEKMMREKLARDTAAVEQAVRQRRGR